VYYHRSFASFLTSRRHRLRYGRARIALEHGVHAKSNKSSSSRTAAGGNNQTTTLKEGQPDQDRSVTFTVLFFYASWWIRWRLRFYNQGHLCGRAQVQGSAHLLSKSHFGGFDRFGGAVGYGLHSAPLRDRRQEEEQRACRYY
jgi:hypothetical protein